MGKASTENTTMSSLKKETFNMIKPLQFKRPHHIGSAPKLSKKGSRDWNGFSGIKFSDSYSFRGLMFPCFVLLSMLYPSCCEGLQIPLGKNYSASEEFENRVPKFLSGIDVTHEDLRRNVHGAASVGYAITSAEGFCVGVFINRKTFMTALNSNCNFQDTPWTIYEGSVKTHKTSPYRGRKHTSISMAFIGRHITVASFSPPLAKSGTTVPAKTHALNSSPPPVETNCVGFGYSGRRGELAQLNTVVLTIKPFNDCRKYYPGADGKIHFCAEITSPTDASPSCHGDTPTVTMCYDNWLNGIGGSPGKKSPSHSAPEPLDPDDRNGENFSNPLDVTVAELFDDSEEEDIEGELEEEEEEERWSSNNDNDHEDEMASTLLSHTTPNQYFNTNSTPEGRSETTTAMSTKKPNEEKRGFFLTPSCFCSQFSPFLCPMPCKEKPSGTTNAPVLVNKRPHSIATTTAPPTTTSTSATELLVGRHRKWRLAGVLQARLSVCNSPYKIPELYMYIPSLVGSNMLVPIK